VGARGAIVRADEDLSSEKVGEIPQGTAVGVREVRGRRVLIFAPLQGWVSSVATTGDHIVRPPTPPLLRPNGERGEDEVGRGGLRLEVGGEYAGTPDSTEPPSPLFTRHTEYKGLSQGVQIIPVDVIEDEDLPETNALPGVGRVSSFVQAPAQSFADL